MEEGGIAGFPRAVYGRIPNFEGTSGAAERLKQLPELREARVIKSNQDSLRKPVRRLALEEGKPVHGGPKAQGREMFSGT